MARALVVLFFVLLWVPVVFADGFVAYVSPLAGFRIAFPEDWIVENPPDTVDPTLMLSARSGEAHVWVTLEYTYYPSFDAFRAQVREDILLYPGAEILGEGPAEVDYVPAYWYMFSFPEGGKAKRGILYLFFKNQGFYRIICWTSEASFDVTFPTFREIVQSFTTQREVPSRR